MAHQVATRIGLSTYGKYHNKPAAKNEAGQTRKAVTLVSPIFMRYLIYRV